jgi:N-methylhydantoinase A
VWRIGVDTGGTFTDVVAIDEDGNRRFAKVPSTPPEFEEGIVEGIRRLGIDPTQVQLIFHGTTVTTNAVITKTGGSTALLTTEGFTDILEMRRGIREDLYDVTWDPPQPLVPRYNRLPVSERVNYAGEVLKEIDEENVKSLAAVLRKRGVQAVAICLLHSYVNPANEQRLSELIREYLPDVYLTASAQILPQPPEFERTSTVVANAYLGPVLTNYLERLGGKLKETGHDADILLMHSAGGLMTVESALLVPVRTAGSGPAAGVMGAAAIGEAAGRPNLISMDMGGTSCDISVISDGRPRLTMSHSLEWGLPVQFPSIDFVAIGAGGGSIAWIDPAGYPKLGPDSAGSRPGPACYGLGGRRPTTTDANLVLRRLQERSLLGGALTLDAKLAAEAIQREIAQLLKTELEAAAAGIVRIANANMASAIRLVTVHKGFDPRDFSLVAFGGAGPLHAVEVARELSIPEVIIPPQPGLISAMGLLCVDIVQDISRSFVMAGEGSLSPVGEGIFEDFEQEMGQRLKREGALEHEIQIERFVDVRYVGQVHTITVPVRSRPFTPAALAEVIDRFHTEHEREYRYCRRDWPVEISVLRVQGRVVRPRPQVLSHHIGSNGSTPHPVVHRDVFFEDGGWVPTRIYDRSTLQPEEVIEGPAIVEEFDSTTLLPPGVKARIDRMGNIVVATV